MLVTFIQECFEVKFCIDRAEFFIWLQNHIDEWEDTILYQIFFEEYRQISRNSLHQVLFTSLCDLEHDFGLTFVRNFVLQDHVEEISEVILELVGDDIRTTENRERNVDHRESFTQSIFSFDFGEIAQNLEIYRSCIEIYFNLLRFYESAFEDHQKQWDSAWNVFLLVEFVNIFAQFFVKVIILLLNFVVLEGVHEHEQNVLQSLALGQVFFSEKLLEDNFNPIFGKIDYLNFKFVQG